MKATDLRIGNFIFYNEIVKNVSSLKDEFINFKTEEVIIGNYKYNQSPIFHEGYFEGIPITEEWLLKFGFVWDDFEEEHPNYLVFKHGNRSLFYSDRSDNFSTVKFIHSILGEVVFLYVHQLQNLYHCLCGKELEIQNI